MKVIYDSSKSKIYKNGDKIYKFNCQSNSANFQKEIRLYEKIKNKNIPNIIKFSFYDEKIKMIEMDYYPYNIENYLADKYNIDISNTQINTIIFKIVFTLKTLHNNLIIHGDYKAKNMMLDRDFNLIIIDFDMSSCYDNNNILESRISIEKINTEMKDDIKKLNFLIYQLLYKVEYKPKLYNNYNKMIETIKKDHFELASAMKNLNIDKILSYFSKLI